MMTSERVTAREYKSALKPRHVYNSTEFSELNAHKVDDVVYLLFSDTKLRGGITLGQRADGSLVSGFSAPFGGFDFTRQHETPVIISMARELRRRADGRPLSIVMPPEFYMPSENAATRYALMSAGYKDEVLVNHHFGRWGQLYSEVIDSKARNKLSIARRAGFVFAQCGADEAYAVIAANRERRGYPLAMSLDEVKATSKIVGSIFFMLSKDETPVAAAMVNMAAGDVAQLIYWGDNGLFSELHPMNLLAAELAAICTSSSPIVLRRKFDLLDLGPSGTFGELSPGLAAFKESVGGIASLKHRFTV